MASFIAFIREFILRKLGRPVIGIFVVAWAVLHWDHLILLFWGSGLLEQRIDEFKSAIYQAWYKKYGLPIGLTAIYLLFLPYLSYAISWLQIHARKITHDLRVNATKQLLEKEKELNVARVLADPNKQFVEELASQKIKQEKLALEKQQAKTEKAKAEAEQQQAEAEKAKSEAAKQVADNKVKEKRALAEKLKLESAAQIQRATIASNRFPAAYMVMQFLDKALKADGVVLGLEHLASIIAILFGYEDFESLVNDPQFTNEISNKLTGIYGSSHLRV